MAMISVWVTYHLLQNTCAHTWCLPQDQYERKPLSISHISPAGMLFFQYHQLGYINSNAQPRACFFLLCFYAHCGPYVTKFHCAYTFAKDLQYARKQWRLICPISEQKPWRYCFASFAPIWVSFCTHTTLVLDNSWYPVLYKFCSSHWCIHFNNTSGHLCTSCVYWN